MSSPLVTRNRAAVVVLEADQQEMMARVASVFANFVAITCVGETAPKDFFGQKAFGLDKS